MIDDIAAKVIQTEARRTQSNRPPRLRDFAPLHERFRYKPKHPKPKK